MKKNRHAVALGKLGGAARAESLSEERRSEIAKMGGLARVALGEGTLVEAGKKGGRARALNLTAEQRAEIARHAAEKRWGKKKEGLR